MFTSGLYDWGTSAIQVFAGANNVTMRSGPAAHTFDVGDGEKGDEYIVEGPIDEGMHGKKISVSTFDPREYGHNNIWPTISQLDEVTSFLRAVSQKHEPEFLESLKSNKYHHRVAL